MSGVGSKENCVGKYPALWRFTYAYDQSIGRSIPGTGEVETVGKQRATETFDVIATSEMLARAAFDEEFGWKFRDKESNFDKTVVKSGPELVCYVDRTITID